MPGKLLEPCVVGRQGQDILSFLRLLTRPCAPHHPPSAPEVPPPPRTLLEALEQRMERYHVAAAQAKTKGDQRKARMHERIVKVCGGPNGHVDRTW